MTSFTRNLLPALVARPTKTTSHLSATFIAFGSADNEIRLLNIYRRELAIASCLEVPEHMRRVSAEVCADIVAWLGFTPEIDSTQAEHRAPENTDAAAHSLGTGENR